MSGTRWGSQSDDPGGQSKQRQPDGSLARPGYHCRPANGAVLRFRLETSNERWTISDDSNSSWPRLSSPKVNGGEDAVSRSMRFI